MNEKEITELKGIAEQRKAVKEIADKAAKNLLALIKGCDESKSGRSMKCGYDRDYKIICALSGQMYTSELKKLISRLGRLDCANWIEISKEEYIKNEGYLNDNYKVKNGKFYRK